MTTTDLAREFLTATLEHEYAIRRLEECRAMPVEQLGKPGRASYVAAATVQLHQALAAVHDTRLAYVEHMLSRDVAPDVPVEVLPLPASATSVETMQQDVHDLCAALGLPVVARSMSPHDVVQTIVLPRIADLAATRDAAVNILRGT